MKSEQSENITELGTSDGIVARFRAKIVPLNPLIEETIVFSILMALTWIWMPIAYIFDSLPLIVIGWSLAVLEFLWMVLGSHFIRKRGFFDLGFTSPRRLIVNLGKVKGWRDKWNYFLILGTVLAAYIIYMATFTPFTNLMPVISNINQFLISHVDAITAFVIATGEFVLFGAATALFFFKTDNIKPSLKAHAKYGSPFLIMLFVAALIVAPAKVYSQTFMGIVSSFLGYIYWALFQQVTTLVYFNTSAREGLERSKRITNPVARRVIASIITAFFFSAIHFPAPVLSAIAFGMEFILAMLYYEPKTRNIFVTCLIHAMAGVVIVFFLNIDLSVGFLTVLGNRALSP
ncbi:MAG TPA: CPBP family glutamic-type intramembrane protease [Candidatus Lokiarchaeia archaeon]|nr:CPBP family glutamic-type intramembrane protease [Candidatus Lokiarchaeia archaeon]